LENVQSAVQTLVQSLSTLFILVGAIMVLAMHAGSDLMHPIGALIVGGVAGGFIVYGVINKISGIRLDEESEYRGADLAIHKISANSSDK